MATSRRRDVLAFTVSASSLDDALSRAYDIAGNYFGSRDIRITDSEATIDETTLSGDAVSMSVGFRVVVL